MWSTLSIKIDAIIQKQKKKKANVNSQHNLHINLTEYPIIVS